MKVKKESLFFKMVKDKKSMSDSRHPDHTAMNFIGNVIHTFWIYGAFTLMILSTLFVLFSQNRMSLEDKYYFTLGVIWIYYLLSLPVSIVLLIIIEPFISKKWNKLEII